MKLMKRILKNELGQVLPMALIMLVLGGLLVVPTLHFMTTNLNANRMVDQSNLRLYAADAGTEKILWNIQYNPDGFTLPQDDDPPTPLPEFTLNDMTVAAQIGKQADQPYKIHSTATGDDGHSTTVECYIDTQAAYSYFFDSAITAGENVTLRT